MLVWKGTPPSQGTTLRPPPHICPKGQLSGEAFVLGGHASGTTAAGPGVWEGKKPRMQRTHAMCTAWKANPRFDLANSSLNSVDTSQRALTCSKRPGAPDLEDISYAGRRACVVAACLPLWRMTAMPFRGHQGIVREVLGSLEIPEETTTGMIYMLFLSSESEAS